MHHPALILSLAVLTIGCTTAPGAARSRPNIVLIMADDMGYSDIGCYGGEIATPNLDRLAAEGIRFTQFYNMPRCSPTRAALLTGLYSHEAGLGEVPEYGHLIGGPGYLKHLNDQCVTLAEVLRGAGYATYMTGKWHVGRERPHWPVDRGFEKSEALIDCCSNYFGDPEANEERKMASMRERYAIDDQLWRPPEEGFHSTDWFGANAARMIRGHRSEKPFFLYLSFTAPHWPIQARPEDIAKYKGRYREGWSVIRQRRFERMKKMGVVSADWTLPPPDGPVPDWNKLSEIQRDNLDTRMAIYAAMIDVMDRNIGGVLDALQARGLADNTLVLFLSDNGATHENPNRGKPGAVPGSRDSYIGYGMGWAMASNTPFRLYKHWVHEGGISTPLIARWPKGIAAAGTFYRHPAHLIDFMPTVVQLAGASYPETFAGKPIVPMRGVSLVPVFNGSREPLHVAPLFWEHQGNAAVRDGRWKLVRREDGGAGWELYDLAADRTEMRNLAAQHRDRVAEMERQFLEWAARSQVKWPWPIQPYSLK
jgi:arylsulfatase